mgnify:CR=1 FL=1
MEVEISTYYPPLINQTHLSKKQNNRHLLYTLLGISIVIVIVLIFSIIINNK